MGWQWKKLQMYALSIWACLMSKITLPEDTDYE